MINTQRLLKVSAAWMSVVYVVCFGGVAFFPGIREAFMNYALHATNVGLGENVMTLMTFITGLIIWDVIASAAAWLFAVLWNGIKQ